MRIRIFTVAQAVLIAIGLGASANATAAVRKMVCTDKGCKPAENRAAENPTRDISYAVKQDEKNLISGYVFVDESDCSFDLGSWSLLSLPQHGVTSTQVVRGQADGPCPNVDQYNSMFYTWTDTSETAYRDKFKALWSSASPETDTYDIVKLCPEGKYRDPKSKKCLLLDEQYEEDEPKLDDWEEDPCFGNPIVPLRGAKVQVEPLGINIGGHELTITYDSSRIYRADLDNPDPLVDRMFQPLTQSFDFGLFWASSLHKKVVLTKDASGAVDGALVHIGNNRLVKFLKKADGSFKPAVGNAGLKLSRGGGGFRLKNLNEGWFATFDADDGKMNKLEQLDGQYLTFKYSDLSTPAEIAPEPGLMIRATDSFGRFIEFRYRVSVNEPSNVQAAITQIFDSNGKYLQFFYGVVDRNYKAQLAGIVWQDFKTKGFSYEWPKNPKSKRPWALVGITDEEESQLSAFGYDAGGAATTTVRGDKGALSFTASATSHGGWRLDSEGPVGDSWRRVLKPAAPVDLVIQSPNGQSSSYTTGVIAGRTRLLGRTQPAGAGCPAATNSAKHDDEGNVKERVTFGGKKSCFEFLKGRALESVRLVGLATDADHQENCPAVPLAGYIIPTKKKNWQKVTTTWHPEWNLKTAEAAPGLITYWVYNGQPHPITHVTEFCAPDTLKMPDDTSTPVLCETIVQPTTDTNGSLEFAAVADGPARTASMDYDATGHLVQRVGEAGASDTVKLAYYSSTSFSDDGQGHHKGDLKTLEDQNHFVTTFNLYNKAGQILKITLPTNEVRTYTYKPRGMLDTAKRTAPGEAAPLVEIRTYYDTGLLKCIKTEEGEERRFYYDTAYRLEVEKFDGASLDFWYRPSGKVESLELRDGQFGSPRKEFEYDDLERVKKVTEAMPSPWVPSAQITADSRTKRYAATAEPCQPEEAK